jgi:hypothetical protein
MANSFTPIGFTAVMRRDGSAWTGNQTPRKISATSTTAFYKGDLIAVLPTGFITAGAAGVTTALGIFQGCRYVPTAVGYMRHNNFWPGSGNNTAAGDIECWIIDDPGAVFEVQSTGAAPLTIADLGINIDVLASTGNAFNGLSTQAVNAATAATTATFPFRVWAVPGSSVPSAVASNLDPTAANNIVQVVWNNFHWTQTTGV